MFCQNCGAQNPIGTSFCSSCGAPMNAGVPVAPAHAQNSQIPGKGMGIASMVLGIISLLLFCTGWLAIICAIIGTVLGGVSLKKAKNAGVKNGIATAGLVCSLVALGLAVVIYIYALYVLEEAAQAFGTTIF